MISFTPTTELEAVNRILATIGESNVNTLTGEIPEDAAKARDRLNGVSRDLQTRGWTFNKDPSVTLLNSSTTNEIQLPQDTIAVVFIGEPDLTTRGNRVYNRTDRTFRIGRSVTADLTVFLPYADLPEPARRFIFVKASRSFQDDEIGDGAVHRIRKSDEQEAWVDFLNWDYEQNKYSLQSNPMVQRMKQKRPANG